MKSAHQKFGKIIQEYRIKKDLTQRNLAELLGYDTAQFISIMERGLTSIPYRTIGQLIKILDLPEKKILKMYVEAFEEDLRAKVDEGKKEIC